MDESKPHPDPKDFHEGPEAAKRFLAGVRSVLSTSPAELKKRDEIWRKKRENQFKKTK